MIARRQFVFVAAACALGAVYSICVQAQAIGKVYRVGILDFGNLNDRDVAAFLERLGPLGYVEGRNLQIELENHLFETAGYGPASRQPTLPR